MLDPIVEPTASHVETAGHEMPDSCSTLSGLLYTVFHALGVRV
jgi:hypothetical protein